MGFQKPSKIQERALPLLLQNPYVHATPRRRHPTHASPHVLSPHLSARNMIGQSQSGTGKTAAFALTMLSRVDMDLKQPQVRAQLSARDLLPSLTSSLSSGHLHRTIS